MKTITHAEEEIMLRTLGVLATDPYDAKAPERGVIKPTVWKGRRNLLAFLLMLDSGLRVGELVQLLRSDCFIGSTVVTQLAIRSSIAKGKHARTIPLSERVRESLRSLHPQNSLIPDLDHPIMLITSCAHGRAITTRQVQRIIEGISEKCIHRPIHPHALRHTFATRLNKITDLRTVQELLGHRNVSSTQIYTHITDDDKFAAINALSAGIPNSHLTPHIPGSLDSVDK